MRITLLTIYFSFSSFFSFSQASLDAEAAATFYYYPQFINGNVFFKAKQPIAAKLNYNLALGEMHFITKNGDTLALSNEDSLQFISIESDTFYFNKGYAKVVESYAGFKLVSKLKRFSEVRKPRGAYGEDLSGMTTTNINHFSPADRASIRLAPNRGSYGPHEISYFLVDERYSYTPVSKKTIRKFFSKYKQEIDSYIITQAIDITVEADLKKLFSYISGLNLFKLG